jgi:sulfotransferase family protein
MLTVPSDREELRRLYEASYEASLEEKDLFQDLETFCLFIGSGRSGHSLVGSLLDAHPRMIVSHQLHVLTLLRADFSKWQMYHLILANSRHQTEQGRSETGYSYAVPGQWQGRFNELKVIGDKSALATETMVRAHPSVLEQLSEKIELPIKLIHAMRNPYDNISTIAKRTDDTLASATQIYFSRMETVAALETRLKESQLLHVRNENLVNDPTGVVTTLCRFLGVDSGPDYLQACAGIVYENPHKSREEAPWTPDLISKVAGEIERFPFLEGYRYDP